MIARSGPYALSQNIETIAAEKADLRRRFRAIRAEITADEATAAAHALAHGSPTALGVREGAIVAGYWPLRTELDPRPLMQALAAHGHPLALPVVGEGRVLTFRGYHLGDPLEAGPHGTRQPLATSAIVAPDLILVPFLAADRCGYRLGYGGGYYDATLSHLRADRTPVRAIGLGYSECLVDRLPRLPTDQPLDGILTPDQFRHFDA